MSLTTLMQLNRFIKPKSNNIVYPYNFKYLAGGG